MKIRSVLVLGITLFLGTVAFAQDDHKIEATGDYSYFRLNPGLPSVWNSQNLNGGGGQGALYFKPWLAFAADLQGYGSFTQCPKSSSEFTGCASGNLFTYTFGPQIKYRAGKLEPFAEVLLGGAHSNFYANACNKNTGECGSRSPSNNAFALAIGGGVDIAVSSKFAIRLVDADYELTHFGNNFTGGNNSQSNFRFQTGVQFRFWSEIGKRRIGNRGGSGEGIEGSIPYAILLLAASTEPPAGSDWPVTNTRFRMVVGHIAATELLDAADLA